MIFLFFLFFNFPFFWLHVWLAEIQRRQFLERMGEAFLLAVLDEYCGALQSLGSDLFGFLQNLGSVYQEMKTTSSGNRTSSSSSSNDEGNIIISNHYDISFSCVPEQGRLTLHFRTALAACGYLWAGVLKVHARNEALNSRNLALMMKPESSPSLFDWLFGFRCALN